MFLMYTVLLRKGLGVNRHSQMLNLLFMFFMVFDFKQQNGLGWET